MKKIAIYIILLAINYSAYSQWSQWKRYRYEAILGIGTATFMGDLGGGKNNDSWIDDYFGDFDFSSTRPTIYGGIRYKLSPSFNMRFNMVVGWVTGDDKWSDDPARFNRNLNFNSIIFEQSAVVEYNILKENNAKRWSKRRNKRVRAYSINLYTFLGVGGFYFNPKGYVETKEIDVEENGVVVGKETKVVPENGDDKIWYDLSDIGTEGQTVEGSGIDKYKKYMVCFPFGLGFKIGINRKLDFGVEYGYRYSFTDYIDDVGGSYYDNLAIIEANGGNIHAGYLADNRIGGNYLFTENDFMTEEWAGYDQYYEVGDRKPIQGGTSGAKVRSGDANDAFMFLIFNLSYKLRTTRRGLPKFRTKYKKY